MPVSGLDWKYQVKDLSRLFRRWGSHASNIRGVFNGILPVQIVDRWRDEDEGSLFAMTIWADAQGITAGWHPSCVIGTIDDDTETEILGWQAWYRWRSTFTAGLVIPHKLHLFTPIAPYTPLDVANPVGFYTPGMITDYGFTFGNTRGIGGFAAALPPLPSYHGYMVMNKHQTSPTISIWYSAADQAGSLSLDRPIRLPPGSSFAWQLENYPASSRRVDLQVSVIYRERKYKA